MPRKAKGKLLEALAAATREDYLDLCRQALELKEELRGVNGLIQVLQPKFPGAHDPEPDDEEDGDGDEEARPTGQEGAQGPAPDDALDDEVGGGTQAAGERSEVDRIVEVVTGQPVTGLTGKWGEYRRRAAEYLLKNGVVPRHRLAEIVGCPKGSADAVFAHHWFEKCEQGIRLTMLAKQELG